MPESRTAKCRPVDEWIFGRQKSTNSRILSSMRGKYIIPPALSWKLLGVLSFVKMHKTIRCTSAMQAGVANSAWTVQDLVEMADA
jgi:hypothetical protein